MMGKRQRHILIIVVLVFFCMLSLLIGAAATVSYLYRDLVKPNTFVSGQSVGGQSFLQAAQDINNNLNQLLNSQIKLEYNGNTKSLLVSDFEVTASSQEVISQLTQPSSTWEWLQFGYWRDFFKKKSYTIAFSYDKALLRNHLEKEFNITTTVQNASLKVEKGELIVADGQSGYSVDVENLARALEKLFQGDINSISLVLRSSEIGPDITKEMAEQAKQELLAKLKPVNLTLNDQTFTISEKDQYQFLDFNNEGSVINTAVSEEKIKNFVISKIAKKFDIKMEPRMIASDTREVLNEGKEGRLVQVSELSKAIYRQIYQFQYQEPTIIIPTKTIAITEKIKYPSFVAGLYEGKYIYLNLAEQRMYLMEGQNQIASHLVSTGKWSMPTPKGTVYIRIKISFAYSRSYGVWMPWWLGLSKNPDGTGYLLYGIHELPCYNKSCTIRDGQNQLGRAVSHGCIRLGTDAAKKVYDWAEEGMPVSIN